MVAEPDYNLTLAISTIAAAFKNTMRPLRLLTGTGHQVSFNILHGQRNAVFAQRELGRYHSTHIPSFNYSAVTLERACGFDLLHTFNAVPIKSSAPFVITFEDVAPRVLRARSPAVMHERLVRKLSGPECLGLIAMSQYALRVFERQHAGDARLAVLRQKVQQIYPTVHGISPRLRPPDGQLCLFFVGGDFLRKGGPVVTRAHSRLRRDGVPVRTVVVSSLWWSADDYVGPGGDYDVEGEFARLNQPGIEHLRELSNEEIRRHMSEAHFTLLPTLHDTFGYSSLESLACGTPVLATDTCALPEVVDDGTSGALLPLESDGQVGNWRGLGQRWKPGYADLYRSTVEDLADQLAIRLQQFWDRPHDLAALRAGAAERFVHRFSPTDARQRLEELYEQCRLQISGTGQSENVAG